MISQQHAPACWCNFCGDCYRNKMGTAQLVHLTTSDVARPQLGDDDVCAHTGFAKGVQCRGHGIGLAMRGSCSLNKSESMIHRFLLVSTISIQAPCHHMLIQICISASETTVDGPEPTTKHDLFESLWTILGLIEISWPIFKPDPL